MVQAGPPPACQQAPLDLVLRPSARGLHPFLAVTLGDKGNRDNICVGLSTQWLLMAGRGDARSRMDHLDYGSRGQHLGAQRQQLYCEALARAFANNDETPIFTANSAAIEAAGFSLRRAPKSVRAPGGSAELARAVAADVAQAGRKHVLSLRFESAQGHAIACSCDGGQLTLFDPNLGEFQASRQTAAELLRALIDHYNDLRYEVACMNEYRLA
jgi:YopT-type cysteine protease-like protein